jgi:hypothetical protein
MNSATSPGGPDREEARGAVHETFNNGRDVVSAFLKIALQRDWITDNPPAKIQPRRGKAPYCIGILVTNI